jgi:predicted Rossmann-fold nucleotide-binding protein
VVIFGEDFHTYILEHIEKMVSEKTISPRDKNLYLVTNNISEACDFIKSKTAAGLGLKHTPMPFLGEKR